MTTGPDLLDQLRDAATDALSAMLAVPEVALASPGYEAGWTVRQIMAHVASMEFTYRRLPAVAAASGDAQNTPGGAFDMDGYNARQVARRAEVAPADLIDEFTRGRAALLVEFAALDEALLRAPMRSAGGIAGTLGEVIAATAVEHVRTHCADFVRAAGAEPAPGDRFAAGLLLAAAEAAALVDPCSAARWLARGGPEDWSAAGISGHMLEMMPYWAAKLQLLVADPQAPVVRALDAPERLGGVVNGETLTPAAGAEALRRTAAAAAAVLRALPAAAWEQPIEHPRFGAVTLAVLTQNVLVGHAGDHVRHIAATLHAAG